MSHHAEELRCECCGGALKIVCAKTDCTDPLEQRRKSTGPVPAAPAGKPEAGKPEARRRQHGRRHCFDCSIALPIGVRDKRCGGCKAALKAKRPTRYCSACRGELAAGYRKKRCSGCENEKVERARHVDSNAGCKPKRPRTPAEQRQQEIGRVLRAAMLRARIGTDELSKSLGKSSSTVTCWETGNVPISRKFIPQLAKRFSLSESQLTNELTAGAK